MLDFNKIDKYIGTIPFIRILWVGLKDILNLIRIPIHWILTAIKYIFTVFEKIYKYKTDFFFWAITSFGIALFGIWLPLLIDFFTGLKLQTNHTTYDVYVHLLKNNPYIIYSITFLAETLLSTILNFIEKREEDKGLTKLVMGLIVLLYIIVLSVLVYEYREQEMPSYQQHIILAITIILGLLLFPLKSHFQEDTADKLENEQNKKVKNIVEESKKNETTTYVEEGVLYLNETNGN